MRNFIPMLMLSTCLFLHARGSIESIEKQLSEYEIPADEVGEKIPSFRITDGSLNDFVELVEGKGIKVSVQEELKDRALSISLRRLSLNKMLDFCTEAVGGDWVYSNSMVVIYSDVSNLNGSFKRDAREKSKLKSKLLELESKKRKRREHAGPLSNLIITEFSVEKVGMKEFARELRMRGVASDPEGKGINIILLGPEVKTDLVSYKSGDMELSKILNRVCNRYDYEWEYRGNIIVVQKSNSHK